MLQSISVTSIDNFIYNHVCKYVLLFRLSTGFCNCFAIGFNTLKVTGYLDSPHMLSQYLLIHSEAIKAMIKEI